MSKNLKELFIILNKKFIIFFDKIEFVGSVEIVKFVKSFWYLCVIILAVSR